MHSASCSCIASSCAAACPWLFEEGGGLHGTPSTPPSRLPSTSWMPRHRCRALGACSRGHGWRNTCSWLSRATGSGAWGLQTREQADWAATLRPWGAHSQDTLGKRCTSAPWPVQHSPLGEVVVLTIEPATRIFEADVVRQGLHPCIACTAALTASRSACAITDAHTLLGHMLRRRLRQQRRLPLWPGIA